MRLLRSTLSVAVVLATFCTVGYASGIDLYDFAVNVTGPALAGSADWQDLGSADPTMLAGMSAFTCCADATGGTTPGTGTTTYMFNPGVAGAYVVSMYFDYDLTLTGPVYNEYGIVDPNGAGSPPTGMGYEIFNVNAATGDIVLYPAVGISGAEVYGTPNNTNEVPGTTDNFLGNCTAGASCNADVGLALSYSFTLAANQYAVLTASGALANPGGWALEQVHPVDSANPTETDFFLSGTLSVDTVSQSPEPGSWILLGIALMLVGGARLRHARARKV